MGITLKTQVTFQSFDRWESGQELTRVGNMALVLARNPYGSHNLIMIEDREGNDFERGGYYAIAHGNEASLYRISRCVDRAGWQRLTNRLWTKRPALRKLLASIQWIN